MGEWLEISVQVERAAVEEVSDLFSRYGYQEGVVLEEASRPAANGISLEPIPDGPVWVRTYLPANADARATVETLRTCLLLLGHLAEIGPLQVRVVQEKEWAEAWKAGLGPMHIGRHLVVVPSWQRYCAHRGDVYLRIDPGMAFGTGLHPTTRLCLLALERLVRPGMRVLDLGTGSGILAIAAARLGSTWVLALDIDPVAVSAAVRNVRRNRVADRVQVRQGSLEPGMGPFALITANLLARSLSELADRLANALVSGGYLIGSGILREQGEMVEAAWRAAGLEVVERQAEEDWLALVAKR
ncbi:MAG: 50S ribosomal protein L11 methyltransferase [Chloroflexia bacterium]